MKIKLLLAALLLGGTVHAQTTPATLPQPATPASPAPQIPPPVGTIDRSPLPTTQQPRQDRVRKRQTVMDGQPSPGVKPTGERRTPRPNSKKPRPARDPQLINEQ